MIKMGRHQEVFGATVAILGFTSNFHKTFLFVVAKGGSKVWFNPF